MKNSINILILLFIISSTACEKELFSCLQGEGTIETRMIDIDDITGFEIGIGASVIVKEGDSQMIEITAHPNVIDRIIDGSKIQGETWEVDIDGCTNLDDDDIQITFTLPTIKVATINGSASIATEGVFSNIEKINLEIDGDGIIDFQLESVEKVDIEIKGSGTIKVKGITSDQSIDISGSGTIRNFDLQSTTTKIEVSGDADVNVSVDDVLRIDASGSGRICYQGNPTLTLENSGDLVVDDCN